MLYLQLYLTYLFKEACTPDNGRLIRTRQVPLSICVIFGECPTAPGLLYQGLKISVLNIIADNYTFLYFVTDSTWNVKRKNLDSQ